MVTQRSGIEAKIATQKTALKSLKTVKETMVKAYHSFLEGQFRAAGGCQSCQGRGWTVTWDTMDSMSGCYAEYGACSNPECNALKTGPNLNPEHFTKYDGLRGPSAGKGDPAAYERLCGSITRQIDSIEAVIKLHMSEIEGLMTFKKGDTALVVKGRKVPVGTRGIVRWTDTNPNYGGAAPTRIGIDTGVPDPKNPGKTIWEFTSVTNCEKQL
jgi:hypothetical protein